MDENELISDMYWGCCEGKDWHEDLDRRCFLWRWLDIGGGGPVGSASPGTPIQKEDILSRRRLAEQMRDW